MVWHSSDLERLCSRPSCKSEANRTHGMTGHRLFSIYTGMLQRCGHFPTRHKNAKRYADRGIIVCPEWRADVRAFVDWAYGNGYADHLQIDRIDNDGPYAPDNCRWVTRTENMRTCSRTCLTLEKARGIRTLWASGVDVKTIADRYSVSARTVAHVVNGRTWKEDDGQVH